MFQEAGIDTENRNIRNYFGKVTLCTRETLAGPGAGGAPGARPPNGRGPMILFIPKRLFYLFFFARDSF